MLLLVAGGAIAIAAIAVAVIVLSNGGGSKKQQTVIEAPQQTSPTLVVPGARSSRRSRRWSLLVSRSRPHSLRWTAPSRRRTMPKPRRRKRRQRSAPHGAGSRCLPPRPPPGICPARCSRCSRPTTATCRRLGRRCRARASAARASSTRLATGAQSAFDGISNVIPTASSSVSGSNNLGNWARGAARPHKAKAQSSSSSSLSASTPAAAAPTPAPAPPAPVLRAGQTAEAGSSQGSRRLARSRRTWSQLGTGRLARPLRSTPIRRRRVGPIPSSVGHGAATPVSSSARTQTTRTRSGFQADTP